MLVLAWHGAKPNYYFSLREGTPAQTTFTFPFESSNNRYFSLREGPPAQTTFTTHPRVPPIFTLPTNPTNPHTTRKCLPTKTPSRISGRCAQNPFMARKLPTPAQGRLPRHAGAAARCAGPRPAGGCSMVAVESLSPAGQTNAPEWTPRPLRGIHSEWTA